MLSFYLTLYFLVIFLHRNILAELRRMSFIVVIFTDPVRHEISRC